MGILTAECSLALVGQFRQLTVEFARMAAQEGVTVVPFDGDSPQHFARLPESLQAPVVERFRNYVHIAGEVLANGGSLRDDQTFLWRFFQRLRLHPPSSLIGEMAEGEIIEVHDRNLAQIFRNLRFFELCSYTLDDLLSRPFYELLERDSEITKVVLKELDEIFAGAPQTIRWLSVDEHTIVECDSSKRFSLRVRQRLMAPLRSVGGEIAGITTFIPARFHPRHATVPENLAHTPERGLPLHGPVDWSDR